MDRLKISIQRPSSSMNNSKNKVNCNIHFYESKRFSLLLCKSKSRAKQQQQLRLLQQQPPELFRHALNGDWDLIPARARSHPTEAEFVYNHDDLADTALHRILRPFPMVVDMGRDAQRVMDQMKFKAVAALLQAHPSAVAMPDRLGRTPLHLACMELSNGCCGAEIVMIMTAVSTTTACCAPDLDGRTPLHYLVARNTFYTTELVMCLISLWPTAISLRDVVGDTPVDIATRRACWSRPSEAYKLLLQLEKESTAATQVAAGAGTAAAL